MFSLDRGLVILRFDDKRINDFIRSIANDKDHFHSHNGIIEALDTEVRTSTLLKSTCTCTLICRCIIYAWIIRQMPSLIKKERESVGRDYFLNKTRQEAV